MPDNSWFIKRYDDRGSTCSAAILSFFLHLVLFAVMATTSVFFPVPGDSLKVETIWLSAMSDLHEPTANEAPAAPDDDDPSFQKAPSSPPILKTEMEKPTAASAETLAEEAEPEFDTGEADLGIDAKGRVALVTEKKELPVLQESPKPEPQSPPQPEKTVVVKAEPTSVQKPASTQTTEHVSKVEPQELPDSAPTAETGQLPSPEPPPVAKPEPPAKVTHVSQPGPAKPPLQHDTAQISAKKASPRQPTIIRSQPVASPNPAPELKLKPASAAIASGPASQVTPEVRKPAKAIEVTKDYPENPGGVKVAEHKSGAARQSILTGSQGIFSPPPAGDLKLIVTGRGEALDALHITVSFREYPKSRHNQPMSRAAARNSVAVVPKRVKVSAETVQEVIEISKEGIYEFRNASESQLAVDLHFGVKTYDNSSRGKTMPVGTRKLAVKGIVAKVLMPEGILWNDEGEFTGSMEDSVSITRFNSETGLVWKEYKD